MDLTRLQGGWPDFAPLPVSRSRYPRLACGRLSRTRFNRTGAPVSPIHSGGGEDGQFRVQSGVRRRRFACCAVGRRCVSGSSDRHASPAAVRHRRQGPAAGEEKRERSVVAGAQGPRRYARHLHDLSVQVRHEQQRAHRRHDLLHLPGRRLALGDLAAGVCLSDDGQHYVLEQADRARPGDDPRAERPGQQSADRHSAAPARQLLSRAQPRFHPGLHLRLLLRPAQLLRSSRR